MKRVNQYGVLGRASLVIVAVLAMVGGVTFAALQSQAAVLRGNTIQTATASLQLSADGTHYASTLDGYVFGNLLPGGAASPANGYPISLKNAGTTALALNLSVNGSIDNPDHVDLTKAHVILNPTGGGVSQNITLADLVASSGTGVALTNTPRLLSGQSLTYMIQVSLEADAVSGPSATIGNIDFTFGATAIN